MSWFFPLTLALSPNARNILGEREQNCGNTDPGRREDSCPRLPWATF